MENSQISELVKKVSEERNELAFSEIFDFIAPKINAYYVKNNIGIEQAEELTQEVLSTIWLKAEQFDPEKSKNPFAYFTQIIYYAFLRRIAKEKKQTHVRNKMIESVSYESWTVNEGDTNKYVVQGFDPNIMLPDEDVYKPKNKTKVKAKGLENFMEKEEDDAIADKGYN